MAHGHAHRAAEATRCVPAMNVGAQDMGRVHGFGSSLPATRSCRQVGSAARRRPGALAREGGCPRDEPVATAIANEEALSFQGFQGYGYGLAGGTDRLAEQLVREW
jgi:hypothetical protein